MKQQILVIHGGEAFDSYEEYFNVLRNKQLYFDRLGFKDWKSRLGKTLGEKYEVISPSMPNKQNARYPEWKIWFEKFIPYLQDGLVLIGHSLGGLFLAKYLSEEKFPREVKATFLIAAPYDVEVPDFALSKTLERFEKQAGELFLFHSSDDAVVPIGDLTRYKAMLPGAKTVIIENRQHFNQETFPEIVKEIQRRCEN